MKQTNWRKTYQMILLMKGSQKTLRLSSGGQTPRSTGFPHEDGVLGTHQYQCTSGVVVRGCVHLQWIFLKTLSTRFPMSWWVIYEHTCPHHAECSAVFDPKRHDLHASPSLFTSTQPSDFFCLFPWIKEILKGKQKTEEH